MDKITFIIDSIVAFLSNFGIVGGFLLVILESIIPILPLGVFVGLNTLAYGNFVGFILSYFATVIGCMLSFTVFRNVIKHGFYKLFKGKTKEKLEKQIYKISNIDFNVLVIILAMPFTPAFLINIAAGLSNIKGKKYLCALLIGKLSIIYFWGYVGTSLLESFTNIYVIIKLVLIVLIAYVISKIVEIIFKVEE